MERYLKNQQSGFTLLEMSIVLFIISLLVLIMLPNLTQQRKNANRIHNNAMVSVIQTQVEAYENDTGKHNVTLEMLNKDNYLTTAQVQRARKQHIRIVGDKVMQ